MKKEELEILKIVNALNQGNASRPIGLPSIDRRMLIIFSEFIYQGKLKNSIVELVENDYLKWTSGLNSSVTITEKGVNYLNKHVS